MEPPGAPGGDQQSIHQMQQSVQELSKSVEELVSTLKSEIVTMAPAGEAKLPKEAGPSVPQTFEEGDVDTGFGGPSPTGMGQAGPQGGSPFTSSLHRESISPTGKMRTETPIQRRTSMKKSRSSAPTAPPKVKRQAEEGIASAPPETVELVYNEKTDKVDGTEPFVKAPHVTTEGEIERVTKSQKKEEGLPEFLFEESTAALRVARKARLYGATPADIAKNAMDVVASAAEKKASDLAGLHIAKYISAMELAHKAQERGIESFPLVKALASRLAEMGVSNAEIVASEALSGMSTDNFRAAHDIALRYMDMSDDAYVQVQATIERTPPATLRGFARSDREVHAQAVRQAAVAGNLGAVTGAPVESNPMDHLRATLRSTGPKGQAVRNFIR